MSVGVLDRRGGQVWDRPRAEPTRRSQRRCSTTGIGLLRSDHEPEQLLFGGGSADPGVVPRESMRLDSVMVRTWHQLELGRPVACPACGGDMRPRGFSGADRHEGCCADCGCVLS